MPVTTTWRLIWDSEDTLKNEEEKERPRMWFLEERES